ncbi:hypothetical protein BJ165DRAFT_343801 [Panaeolus papilionaceus]|nr:hypothetical protein BJ165DRAFT_343801 [Panaeolus papilionaceus]
MTSHTFTAPVLRLPPELVTKVFREIVLEYWNSPKRANKAPPWVPSVSHVRRYWRSAAPGDPQLRSRIGSFPHTGRQYNYRGRKTRLFIVWCPWPLKLKKMTC